MGSATWTVPVDHPAFAGHFPGRPIVPGVVLLDRLMSCVGDPTAGRSIANAKFLSPVGPGETLTFTWLAGAGGAIEFSIASAGRAVASGRLAAPGPLMTATADDRAWTERPERSNLAILRLMVWISLRLGRPIGRLVLYGIAAYFLAFAPTARRASAAYLRRALGREPGLTDLYRHVLGFATTIHDRVYLLNDRFDLFDIEIVGEETIRAAMAGGQGVLLIGAHLGSFEVMRALGRRQTGQAISMLMYEANARKINATLAAINPAATQDIIPLGRLESMLLAKEKIEAGHLVGMLADRGLGQDPARDSRDCDFLGAPAPIPTGPFRVAAMLRRPVLFMIGLYLGGNRYRIHFEPLADFSHVERGHRAAAIGAAQQAYAARLSHYCRLAPYNWFNFFDFWRGAAK